MNTQSLYKLKKVYGKAPLAVTIIIILLAISNVTFSQGRRDFDNTRYPPYNPYDTTTSYVYGDTSSTVIDSTRLLPVDSTARIKYFTYVPEYSPGVRLKEKEHPLLLQNSSHIQYNVQFDSANNVVVRKTFMGEDIQAPLVMSVDEYLANLSEYTQKDVFNAIIADKFKGNNQDELSELFQKFTDITIPLPFKSETIFGPPTINLRINGAIDITASYQNIKSDVTTTTGLGNQNNINFKQEVLVTAKGTVGDKLTIDADWNTQRLFDFENQLKIKYEGYADEVIKKIEAGNVSLETRSGLIQSTQALFGIKGEFQLGPLSLSAVVSQKKSKQEVKDYVGGVQEQPINLKAYEYSENHYFFDTVYQNSFLEIFNSTTPTSLSIETLNNSLQVDDPSFEVWVQADYTQNTDIRFGVAMIDLPVRPAGGYHDSLKKLTSQEIGRRFAGNFRKLGPTEYTVYKDAGFISFKTNIQSSYVVAVSYKTFDERQYGSPSTDVAVGPQDTLLLKLIKVSNPSPDQTPLGWELMLKNIYHLNVSRIIEEGFQLSVQYDDQNNLSPSLPGNPKSLSTMLKIDRYEGRTRVLNPDGIFDYLPGYTINTENGDIIFPSLKPFDEDIAANTSDTSSFRFPEIYTKKKTDAMNTPNAAKYYIIGTAKGEAGLSNVINLGFNIVQGSVKILLGAQELQNNVDYSVDYSTGVVVIKNASALLSRDLKVQYETNDLISLASKTLLGLRGDYKINEKTSLGFTFVNLKQETLNDKVRIGEEPTNNSMFGIDFTTELKPKFLTNLVNMLPGYNTKEESAVTFKGEFAYITPDPNTKRSLIPQDNNESIAYVDDMEGSKKIVSLGTSYASWTMASLPLDTVNIGSTDSTKQFQRGRFRWYNISNDVEVKKVYPLRDVQPGQDRLTSFTLTYDPTTRGIYNYNGSYSQIPDKSVTWNGIMKYLNTTTTDLVTENINFIEFNMRIVDSLNAGIQNGKLVIDLGRISEDAIPNGRLDTEDTLRNGSLDPNLDIGLDLMRNEQELARYNQINGTTLTLADFPNGDPGLDNNGTPGTINYDVINGTEGNREFEGGNRPDTEDLNRNGVMDDLDSYLQYEIALDTLNNQRISGRGEPGSGWFQYRVPLSEFIKAYGGGTLSAVEYVRVWITGVAQPIRLQIVDFNLVGNQWIKTNKADTTYNISVVSIEENPQIYQSPVGGNILRQVVRNSTGNNTLSNEQSLALTVNNLVFGDRKFALKDYNTQKLDLFSYKTLKLFVNGDPSFSYTDENNYDAQMIVRFGTDSNNYYEYRAPIHPDQRPGTPWNPLNEVTINFSDLTAFKIVQDTSANGINNFPVPNGPPGSYYVIKGNPAINNIRQFVLGVEKTRTGFNSVISGSVWFNEIRVLNVEDENGYAFNLNAGVKFADLLDVNLNLSKTDPNFNGLDSRALTRSNRTGLNWDIGATLNLHRFINNALASLISDDWKDFINLPITFRHSEGLVKPRYFPGTDIELEEAALQRYAAVIQQGGTQEQALLQSENLKLEAQTLEVRNELGVNGMSFKFPGSNYLVTNILNKFVYNFSATFGSSRDVTFERRDNFDYRGSVEFVTDFGLADNLHLNIGRMLNVGDDYKEAKLYFALPFLPLAPLFSKNFTASTDFTRTREEKKQRKFFNDDPVSRQFGANRGFGFDWKFIENWIVDLTGTYRFKVGSDLTGFETYNDSLRTQRPEGEVLDNIFFNDALVNFGRDLDYSQTTTFNPKFNIPFIKKFMDLNLAYNVTYGWRNPVTAENTGYDVGFSNNIVSSANFRLTDLFALFSSNRTGLGNTTAGVSDSTNPRNEQSILDVFKLFKTLLPTNINVTFNQSNAVLNPGVIGRPGFGNFWMMPSAKEEFGPSRYYQLGFDMFPGNRVANLNLTDNLNVSNDVSVSTTITPLLPESIRMNLSFKKKWGFTNTNSYFTNDGINMIQYTKAQTLRKTISTFFIGDIEEFRHEPITGTDNQAIITEKFRNQVGSFPFPNWTMTISGVEKFPFFAQFASQVTIDNAFTSEFTENFTADRFDLVTPGAQTVTQSFNPLFGINITFKEAWGGNLTTSFKINNSKNFSLNPSSNNIQTTNTSDWSITTNFSKAGFEIPFFGLSLKNDIAFSLLISKSENEPIEYRFTQGTDIPQKVPGTGSTVMTINPSIQYSLSSRVQMQLFFKHIRTEPKGSFTTLARTNSEGGLNIRISLQ